MLQKIRDNLQGTIAKVIIALIAIPFALFGIEAFFRGHAPAVARVDGEAISESDLKLAIEMQRRRLLVESENKIDPALLEESALRNSVLDSLIDRKLIEGKAKSSGLRVSDSMLDKLIAGDTNFQENGVFSQSRYQALLANNGLSPALHRRFLREEILIRQVVEGLVSSEFVTPREMADLSRITQQSMDVRYLTVPTATNATIPVQEADVESYYQKHKGEYRTKESVTVEYLELKLADLFTPIAEAQLREEFKHRVAGFEGKEERHAAHILLGDMPDPEARAKLAALREKIVAGEDFATLAKANSTDTGSANTGGDLGFSSGDIFPAEFEKALAALKPGEVSQPVKTEFGWHLIKLIETRKQQAPKFEDMRADIEHDLQQRAAEPKFVEAREKLADLTFNSSGLDEAASSLGLKKQISAEFGRDGGIGLFADPRVLQGVFSKEVLDEGQNSEVVEVSKELSVVLRVKDHHPARQRELAEVREQIGGELRAAVLREHAKSTAGQLLERLRGGAGMEEVARSSGYEWQVALQHHRGGPELDPAFSEAVFSHPRASAGSTFGSFQRKDGSVLVFEVSNFRRGELASLGKDQQQTLREVLQRAKSRETGSEYEKQLRVNADIEKSL